MRSLLRDISFGSMLRVLLGCLVAASVAYFLLRPSIHPVAVVKGDDIRHVDSWDKARIQQPHSEQDVLVHVRSPLPLGKIQLYVDDCVQRVFVNGRGVGDDRLPYCNWFDRISIDVAGYTHVGTNTVTVRVHNDRGSGGVRVTPSHDSWLFRSFLAFVMLSIAAFGAWWFARARTAAERVTAVFVVVGTLLRVFYAAYTEFDTRAYDWDGHMEYIRYIADHWVLPVGNQGWEFHQQPLYYLFGGAVLSVMRMLHSVDSFVQVMQFFSLLMSLGTLYGAAWIASLLFPSKTKHSAFERFVFLGLFATLPGLVMFSSRVNNDVLTLLLATLSIGYVLLWWKKGTFELWAAAASFATLALLTKSSALPLISLLALALLLRKQSWRAMAHCSLFLAGLLAVALGGTFIVRVLIQGQDELVPVWVTTGLRVQNFLGAYVTFDPWNILMHPFNNNWIDGERRQYLWEYFFKSAFFGEWDFRWHFGVGATVLLSSALLLVPAWIWGIARCVWKPTKIAAMLFAFMVVSLLALVSFRYLHPNSSNQELRYIAYVVIPIGYFLSRGIASMRYRWPLTLVASVVYAFSLAFIVIAAIHSR